MDPFLILESSRPDDSSFSVLQNQFENQLPLQVIPTQSFFDKISNQLYQIKMLLQTFTFLLKCFAAKISYSPFSWRRYSFRGMLALKDGIDVTIWNINNVKKIGVDQ